MGGVKYTYSKNTNTPYSVKYLIEAEWRIYASVN